MYKSQKVFGISIVVEVQGASLLTRPELKINLFMMLLASEQIRTPTEN